MASCDALIVGGGPAGSSCARKLKQAGLDVLVLDKSQFPRDKVCASWITPEVLQVLQLDPGEYAEGRVMQPIYALRTGMIGRSALQTQYDGLVSYGIRRSGQGWIIHDQIKTKLLIGAVATSAQWHDRQVRMRQRK